MTEPNNPGPTDPSATPAPTGPDQTPGGEAGNYAPTQFNPTTAGQPDPYGQQTQFGAPASFGTPAQPGAQQSGPQPGQTPSGPSPYGAPAQPAYGQPAQFGAAPQNSGPQNSGPQSSEPQGYGQQSSGPQGYGQQGQFGQPAYGQQPGYGQPNPTAPLTNPEQFGQQGQFGAPSGQFGQQGQQGQFGAPSGQFGQQGQPGDPFGQMGAPKPRKSGKLYYIGAGVLVLIAAIVLITAFAFPGWAPKKLSQDAAQKGVVRVLTDDYKSTDVSDAKCPSGQRIKEGDSFTCTVKVGDRERKVTVTFLDDKGNYEVSRPS